jgi:hypothetical protein
MTLLSDEALNVQLTEYANTLADIPDFLDQAKERLEVLKGERDRAELELKEIQEVTDGDLATSLKEVRASVAHDLAILIDWALDAGADPAILSGLKGEVALEVVKARALARSAF